MSADDDTFDIDIYGEDEQAPEQPDEPQEQHQQQDDSQSAQYDYDESSGQQQDAAPLASGQENSNGRLKPEPLQEMKHNGAEASPSVQKPQQGVKRKAPDDDQDRKQGDYPREASASYVDDRPLDPGAMPALKLADLHWWTTEEDLRGFCAKVGAEEELHELSFGEHKINGKSKGEAYLSFTSAQAATAVKRHIEAAAQVKEESGVKKTPFTAYFTPMGNPFKSAAGAAAGGKKDFSQSSSRGSGAYNDFHSRGNFGGRGNYNSHRGGGGGGGGIGGGGGGGGFNNNSMMQQSRQPSQQAGWGMNGMNYNNFSAANPMMGGFGNMGGMGYGNMGRGGMMGSMGLMGRGAFGGMNMNMGMMGGGGRGGGMMGRGGWAGGGYQQQGYGGGSGGGGAAGFNASSGMQQQPTGQSKRAKME